MIPGFSKILPLLLAFAALAIGCASGPAVITSTPDSIAVEFPSDGTVKDASALAKKGCESYGKMANFDSVDATASPKTRVAKFNCVSGAPKTTEGEQTE